MSLYSLPTRPQRDCARTVHEKMWCAVGVSFHTLRRFTQSKTMFATNPSFDLTSSRCLTASALTMMNASSREKGRIAILHEVQVSNRILRGLQIGDQAVA